MAKADSSSLSYTLSQYVSSADSQPVRSICVIPSERNGGNVFQLLAGGQNGLFSVFNVELDTNECLSMVPKDGSRPHTLSAIFSSPISSFAYAAGSRDGNIRIYSDGHSLMRTLKGHEKPVTSLSWISINEDHQYLLSGSWDGTAKIWNVDNGVCMATLPDHENTVTVLGLINAGKVGNIGKVVTASAGAAEAGKIVNHKIRIWSVEATKSGIKCTLSNTPSDNHAGPIRGLSCNENSPNLFISCSNDGTVKVRDTNNGECTLTLSSNEGYGEPPILLDVQTSSGLIAAAVEDGTLAIWSQETGQFQRIPHPGCVWKVLFLANGDICTACQDGYLRIFTRDPSRFANPDEIKKFEDSALESMRKSSSGPSAEEIAKLPKWEMRSIHTGRSEGQIQVFAKDGKAIAAQWNNASKTWIEVGEVMGSNENAGSIDGVKYDHVLPIEVDIPGGGVQKLQIGYNNGENPFVTAQNFIDTYMLDQNYLSQIADYIRQRVGDSAVTLGNESSSSGRTDSTPTMLEISNPPKQQKLYQNVPMKGYFIFDVPDMSKTLPKIFTKIEEISRKQDMATDLTPLENLRSTLLATSRYHSSKIGVSELSVLKDCLEIWNIDSIFPLLDLVRITVLHPDAGSRGKEGLWVECELCKFFNYFTTST